MKQCFLQFLDFEEQQYVIISIINQKSNVSKKDHWLNESL